MLFVKGLKCNVEEVEDSLKNEQMEFQKRSKRASIKVITMAINDYDLYASDLNNELIFELFQFKSNTNIHYFTMLMTLICMQVVEKRINICTVPN